MRQHGHKTRGRPTRPLLCLLSVAVLLGACRVRRERPEPQPVPPQPSGSRHAGTAGASSADSVSFAGQHPTHATKVLVPNSPVQAPEGVLVLAVTSADVSAVSIESALHSVRLVTQQLLDHRSTVAASASGLVPFERASEVPIANGSPSRHGGRAQCDAILVDAAGRASGVGAVTDLDSPANLALEVYRRGWGLVVGDGARSLAAQIGIASQHWSPDTRQHQSTDAKVERDAELLVPSDATTSGAAATKEPSKADGGTAGHRGADEVPEPAAAVGSNNSPTVDSKRNAANAAVTSTYTEEQPSMAALLVRDGAGRFAIAAESCGSAGDPSGQLTALANAGTAWFVGEEGAVFVMGGRRLLLQSLHAERIYRRLVMLQSHKVAAHWGLRTSVGATTVIVVSRLGSALATMRPVVWARNHRDGESSSKLGESLDEVIMSSASESARSTNEESPVDAKTAQSSALNPPPTAAETSPPLQELPVDKADAGATIHRGSVVETRSPSAGHGTSLQASPSSSTTTEPSSNGGGRERRFPENRAGEP